MSSAQVQLKLAKVIRGFRYILETGEQAKIGDVVSVDAHQAQFLKRRGFEEFKAAQSKPKVKGKAAISVAEKKD